MTGDAMSSFLRKVPGLRSGRRWQGLIAGSWYALLLLAGVTGVANGDWGAPVGALMACAISAVFIHLLSTVTLPTATIDRVRAWFNEQNEAATRRARERKDRASTAASSNEPVPAPGQRWREGAETGRVLAAKATKEWKAYRERTRGAKSPMPPSASAVPNPASAQFDPIGSWQDAELVVMRWMQAHGFADAAVTTSGADGGVDVASRAAYAQVKLFSNSAVGRPDVQKIYGVARADGREPFFFASASLGYTREAMAWADQVGVALFTFTASGLVAGVNAYGVEVTQRGQPQAVRVKAGHRSEQKHAARRERARRKAFDRHVASLASRTTLSALAVLVTALYERVHESERVEALLGWRPKGLLAVTDQRVVSLELVSGTIIEQDWRFPQIREVNVGKLGSRLEITVGTTTREYRGGRTKEVSRVAERLRARRSSA